MLFNLYIDDVVDIFDQQCDPIPLLDTYINHFLYADDLVLLSQSRAGLQRCLDKLHQFSAEKRLSVSIGKSKTINSQHLGPGGLKCCEFKSERSPVVYCASDGMSNVIFYTFSHFYKGGGGATI